MSKPKKKLSRLKFHLLAAYLMLLSLTIMIFACIMAGGAAVATAHGSSDNMKYDEKVKTRHGSRGPNWPDQLPLSPYYVQLHRQGTVRGVLVDWARSAKSASKQQQQMENVFQENGKKMGPIQAFLALPYAAPPINFLRFMPPGAVSRYHPRQAASNNNNNNTAAGNHYLANQFSAVCPQQLFDNLQPKGSHRQQHQHQDSDGNQQQQQQQQQQQGNSDDNLASVYAHLRHIQSFLHKQNEDCLYLNLYSPMPSAPINDQPLTKQQSTNTNNNHNNAATTSDQARPLPKLIDANGRQQLLPVIVFIHGQSYDWGTGNAYDGSILSSWTNSIVITFNYRLGILGFLPIVEDRATRANHALWDQIALLHWVRSNIVQFGGDPNNVTLIGYSYGASCAHLLTLSPIARGLFNRVVLMSGSILNHWALSKRNNAQHYGAAIDKTMKDYLNCDPVALSQDSLLSCLRMVHVDKYIQMQISLRNESFNDPSMTNLVGSSPLFGPLLNDEMLFKLLASGNDNIKSAPNQRISSSGNQNNATHDVNKSDTENEQVLNKYLKFSPLEKRISTLISSLTLNELTTVDQTLQYNNLVDENGKRQLERNNDLVLAMINEATGETSQSSRWRATIQSATSLQLDKIVRSLADNMIFNELHNVMVHTKDPTDKITKERFKRLANERIDDVVCNNEITCNDSAISSENKSTQLEKNDTIHLDTQHGNIDSINSTKNDRADDVYFHDNIRLFQDGDDQSEQSVTSKRFLSRKRNAILNREHNGDNLASMDMMFGVSQDNLSPLDIMLLNDRTLSRTMGRTNEDILASRHINIIQYLLHNSSVPIEERTKLMFGQMLPSMIYTGNYHNLKNIQLNHDRLLLRADNSSSSNPDKNKPKNMQPPSHARKAFFYSFGTQNSTASHSAASERLSSNKIDNQPYKDFDYLFGEPLRDGRIHSEFSESSARHHQIISATFMNYLSNFIRHGDPNGVAGGDVVWKTDSLTEWLPYDAFDGPYMTLDTETNDHLGHFADHSEARNETSDAIECLTELDHQISGTARGISINRSQWQTVGNPRFNCISDVIYSTSEQLKSILVEINRSNNLNKLSRNLITRNEVDVNISSFNELHPNDASGSSSSSLYDNMSAHLSSLSQQMDSSGNSSIQGMLGQQHSSKLAIINSTSSLSGYITNRKAMAEALTIIVSAGSIIVVLNLFVAFVVICRLANKNKQTNPRDMPVSDNGINCTGVNPPNGTMTKDVSNEDDMDRVSTTATSSKSSLRPSCVQSHRRMQSKSLTFNLAPNDNRSDRDVAIFDNSQTDLNGGFAQLDLSEPAENNFPNSDSNHLSILHDDQLQQSHHQQQHPHEHQIIFSSGELDIYEENQDGGVIIVPCDSINIESGENQQNYNPNDSLDDRSDMACGHHRHHHHIIRPGHDCVVAKHNHSSLSPSSTISDHYNMNSCSNNNCKNGLFINSSPVPEHPEISQNAHQVPIFVTSLDYNQYQVQQQQSFKGYDYSDRGEGHNVSQQLQAEDIDDGRMSDGKPIGELKQNNGAVIDKNCHINSSSSQYSLGSHNCYQGKKSEKNFGNINNNNLSLNRTNKSLSRATINNQHSATHDGPIRFEQLLLGDYVPYPGNNNDKTAHHLMSSHNVHNECNLEANNNKNLQAMRNEACSMSNESSSSTMTSTNTTYLHSSSNHLANQDISQMSGDSSRVVTHLPIPIQLIYTNHQGNCRNANQDANNDIKFQTLACQNLYQIDDSFPATIQLAPNAKHDACKNPTSFNNMQQQHHQKQTDTFGRGRGKTNGDKICTSSFRSSTNRQ